MSCGAAKWLIRSPFRSRWLLWEPRWNYIRFKQFLVCQLSVMCLHRHPHRSLVRDGRVLGAPKRIRGGHTTEVWSRSSGHPSASGHDVVAGDGEIVPTGTNALLDQRVSRSSTCAEAQTVTVTLEELDVCRFVIHGYWEWLWTLSLVAGYDASAREECDVFGVRDKGSAHRTISRVIQA